ncbi:hypothetical protein BJ322DRAFT_1112311 [Thelephora terrestris]|uniref:Uncharacterized protein n=1 Tax=Thelephora terrestris TaxID=56493 RepID=A0A9P6L3P8_9AGAM|nr:hypothetical protein BJ322DRAFT_1112311 [Thelephora terrestris]
MLADGPPTTAHNINSNTPALTPGEPSPPTTTSSPTPVIMSGPATPPRQLLAADQRAVTATIKPSLILGFPTELIVMICKQVGTSPDIIDRMSRFYLKNCTIISVSQVCSRLSQVISSNPCLLQDIYLDHTSQVCRTADLCLDFIKGAKCPINVYLDLDLRQEAPPGSEVQKLLGQIGILAPRIKSFEFSGELEPYGEFFNRPAPLLRRLFHHFHPFGHGVLFQGKTPLLENLTTAWTLAGVQCVPSPLPNLTELDIASSTFGSTPLRPFLNMLIGSNSLRYLTLHGFAFGSDLPCEPVTLPQLLSLSLYSSDIQTLLDHLHIPTVRKLRFDGYSHPPGQVARAPLFDSPHLFSRLPRVPLLNQAITKVHLSTFSDSATRIFWLALEAPGGFSMDVCMRWSGSLSLGWEGYVTSSIDALTRLVVLSPGAHARLCIQGMNPRPLYAPLLLLDRLGELVIDEGLAVGILTALLRLSPTLKSLVVVGLRPSRAEKGVEEADVIQVLVSFLTKRRQGLRVHLNGRVDGFSRDIPLSLLAITRGAPERGLFLDMFDL